MPPPPRPPSSVTDGASPDLDLGRTRASDGADVDAAMDEAGIVDIPDGKGGSGTAPATPPAVDDGLGEEIGGQPAAGAPEKGTAAAPKGDGKTAPRPVKVIPAAKRGAIAPKEAPKPATDPDPGIVPAAAPIAPGAAAGAAKPPAAAPAAGTPAVVPAAGTPAAAAPKPDKEFDAIEQPKNLNPANRENWEKLHKTGREYKEKYETAVTVIAKLQKEPQIPADVQAKLAEHGELVQFRRIFDIQKDPEFVEKFDKVIEANNDEVYGILKAYKMPDTTINEIKAAGGIHRIAQSWWQENVYNTLEKSADPDDNAAAIILKGKIGGNVQLSYNRKREVEKASASQSDFLKRKDEEFIAKKKADNDIMAARVTEIQNTVPFARVQEIPKDATAEQKAEIEASNKHFKEVLEPVFEQALNPATPLARVETALAAAYGFHLDRYIPMYNAAIAARDQEITQLRAELTKIRGAGKPPTTDLVPPSKGIKPPDRINMKSEDAIEAGMTEAGI